MNSFFLWATLGLVPFVATIEAGANAGCPQCDCCDCCETGTCTCAECTCECCGSGCCSK